jgi:hypothetical protein
LLAAPLCVPVIRAARLISPALRTNPRKHLVRKHHWRGTAFDKGPECADRKRQFDAAWIRAYRPPRPLRRILRDRSVVLK